MPRRRPPASRQLNNAVTRVRRAEIQFGRALRSAGRVCGEATSNLFNPNNIQGSSARISTVLNRYAETLQPWAQEMAANLIDDVNRRDAAMWRQLGAELGRPDLHREVQGARVNPMLARRLNETAALITSLPLEAASRIDIYRIRQAAGRQPTGEVIEAIRNTGQVVRSRADTIARTQVSAISSDLIQARSKFLGSEGYIWQTMEDQKVRHEHRRLNGRFIRWDEPPIAGPNGQRYHAGKGPNCRCWPRPVIPQVRTIGGSRNADLRS